MLRAIGGAFGLLLLVSTACEPVDAVKHEISGRPTRYDFPNGDRCYSTDQGGLSCLFYGKPGS